VSVLENLPRIAPAENPKRLDFWIPLVVLGTSSFLIKRLPELLRLVQSLLVNPHLSFRATQIPMELIECLWERTVSSRAAEIGYVPTADVCGPEVCHVSPRSLSQMTVPKPTRLR
jgi:hypothetical protein